MVDTSSALFTIGVFQDVAWAEKGIAALKALGLNAESMSLIAKDSPDVASLAERTFGSAGATMDIRAVGASRVRGPLVDALQGGNQELSRLGIAATARRVGFQAHDGRIFEALTARGGVLVAITSDARAADALAVMHSYGGGNAAIGAWSGRL